MHVLPKYSDLNLKLLICNISDTRSGRKIVIPDHDMQRFIAVAGTYNDHLLYFQPEELNLQGTKVHITGGD